MTQLVISGYLKPFLCQSIFPGPDHFIITKFSCILNEGDTPLPLAPYFSLAYCVLSFFGIANCVPFINKRAQRALGRSPEEKVKGHSGAIYRGPLMLSTKYR